MVEQKKGKVGEEGAVGGNRRWKDDVESGEPVRGDNQKLVAEIVDIADLAAGGWREAGESRFHQYFHGRSGRQVESSPDKVRSILAQRETKSNVRMVEICADQERKI